MRRVLGIVFSAVAATLIAFVILAALVLVLYLLRVHISITGPR